jgi:hypothetical protein
MAVDFSWMSEGGVLSDFTGDIALTTSDEGTLNLIYSRLKAAVNGWKLYSIGAGLESYTGQVIDSTLSRAVQNAIVLALSNQFLPNGSFSIQTTSSGNELDVYIFVNSTLVSQANITSDGIVTITQVG